jgi:hypothetical protein
LKRHDRRAAARDLKDPVALELLDLALGEPPAIVDAGLLE